MDLAAEFEPTPTSSVFGTFIPQTSTLYLFGPARDLATGLKCSYSSYVFVQM